MKKLDPISQAATDTIEKEKQVEERRKKELSDLCRAARIVGEFQAHRAHSILSDFAAWKKLSEIHQEKNLLKSYGFKTIEDFFEFVGCPKRTTYKNFQIVSALDADFVPQLAQIRPSQRDLLAWTKLPKEKIREILNEDIDIEEMRDKFREECLKNKKLEEEKAAEKKTADRLLRAKDEVVDRIARENEELKEKLSLTKGLPKLPPEQQALMDILIKVEREFLDAISIIRKNVPYDKSPPEVLSRAYYLYAFMSFVCREQRFMLQEYFPEAVSTEYEISDEELPEDLAPYLPSATIWGEAYMKKMAEKKAAKKKRRSEADETNRQYS